MGYYLYIVAFVLMFTATAQQFGTGRADAQNNQATQTASAVSALPAGQSVFQGLNVMQSAANAGASSGGYTAPQPTTTPGSACCSGGAITAANASVTTLNTNPTTSMNNPWITTP